MLVELSVEVKRTVGVPTQKAFQKIVSPAVGGDANKVNSFDCSQWQKAKNSEIQKKNSERRQQYAKNALQIAKCKLAEVSFDWV